MRQEANNSLGGPEKLVLVLYKFEKMTRTDPAWEHCREAYPGDKDRRAMLICKYCERTYNGGVARIKEHLAQTHYCVAPYDGDKDVKVKAALLQCVEKMVTNMEERCDIFFQLKKYEDGIGCFQKPEAILTRKGQQPAGWWNVFGIETEELMNFAVRILNLTCSASRCKRNRSTFSLVRTKRRNRLEQDKFNALVFVMYNMKLYERKTKKKQVEDPLIVDHIDSDDEWIVEKEDHDLPNSTLDGTWLDSNLDVGNIDVLPLDNLIGSNMKSKDTSSNKGKRKISNEEDEVEDDKKSTKEEDRSPVCMDDSNEDPLSFS